MWKSFTEFFVCISLLALAVGFVCKLVYEHYWFPRFMQERLIGETVYKLRVYEEAVSRALAAGDERIAGFETIEELTDHLVKQHFLSAVDVAGVHSTTDAWSLPFIVAAKKGTDFTEFFIVSKGPNQVFDEMQKDDISLYFKIGSKGFNSEIRR